MPLLSLNDYFGTNGLGNPSRDLVLKVTFTQCNVTKLVQYKTQGFWYGLSTDGTTLDQHAFRIRGAFPTGKHASTWQWSVTCSKRNPADPTPDCAGDAGLNTMGRFQVTPGGSGLYSGGFLRVASAKGTMNYLTFDNQSRFFWLGDTVWSANILMSLADWQHFVMARAKGYSDGQVNLPNTGFTVLQLSTAPIVAGGTDTEQNPPFDAIGSCPDAPKSCYRLNPKFWKNVDDKIEFANENGIVVVFAGFIEPLSKSLVTGYSTVATDPTEASIFAQSIAARLYGNFVIFSPGFDHTLSDNIGIINPVGLAIGDNATGVTSRHLVTNHSAGGSAPTDYTTYLQPLATKPAVPSWLDFELFQSGTKGSSQAAELQNELDRAASLASTLWKAKPKLPAINGEAVYVGQHDPKDWLDNHSPYRARQTAYLSMLSGAAGYTMGTCGVVDWGRGGGLIGCPTHLEWMQDDPALIAKTMNFLRSNLQSVAWESFMPQSGRIVGNQSLSADKQMALASDGKSVLVAYLPDKDPNATPTNPDVDNAITIDFGQSRAVPKFQGVTDWPSGWAATWLSPRSSTSKSAEPVNVAPGVFQFTKPVFTDGTPQNTPCELKTTACDAIDWVLKITKGKSNPAPQSSSSYAILPVSGPAAVTSDLRVLIRTVDMSTGALMSEQVVGGDGSTSPGQPQMATEPAGNNLVVWQAEGGAGATISGRILDSQGNPLSPEFVIATGTAALPGHPAVAALPTGEFLVAWSGADENRYGPWIRTQRFDRLGTPLGPASIAVNCNYVAGDYPQVTSLTGGGYVIAWEMSADAGIYVLQIDSGGQRSEAVLAQGTGASPVLESLSPGVTQATVSYGLYTSDGQIAGGDTIAAVTSPPSCASPPLAVNDTFATYQDVPLAIGIQELLGNDAPGVAFDHSAPKCAVSPDGGYCTYTPAPGVVGTDTFAYVAKDFAGNSGTATVTITVAAANLQARFAVTCVNRTCTVHPTSSGNIPVTRWLWNWGDGSPTIEPSPPFGWADQTHTYARSGRYTITHTVYDAANHTSSLQLSVVANTAPAAVNDSAMTARDVPVTIDILVNDTDADGDPLMFTSVTGLPTGASWQAIQLPNRFAIQVTPPDSFVGTLTFTYVALDGWGGTTAPATVTITVNQTQLIVDAVGEQFYMPQNGVPLRISNATLLANDYDSKVPPDPLTIVGFDKSILMGTLVCDSTGCTYTPPINAYGLTLFRYTISDPAGHLATATVRIYVGVVPSHSPAAGDAYFTTTRNTPTIFTIQDIWKNDVDADGDTLTIGGLAGSSGRDFGWLTCTAPMYQCTYNPNSGFVGTDRFPYTVADGINPPVTGYVNVLTLPPATPIFDAREDMVTTGVNQQTYISYAFLTSNDYEPSGYPISVVSVDSTGLIGGNLTCDSFGCAFQPNYSFQGTARFKYTAINSHGATDTAIVKIRVGGTNYPPVATAVTLATPKNTPLRFSIFDLLRHDSDPDNDPLAVNVYGFSAQKGSLSCTNPTYWCTYTPNPNATGTDMLTYSLSDGVSSVSSTVTINIGQ